MSLDSTGNLKQQLTTNLGPKAPVYFDALQNFVTGKISRVEFEEIVTSILTTPILLQIHNALIISLFDATATYKRNALNAAANNLLNSNLNTPPPTASKPPTRKRKRTLLPYQGPGLSEEERTLRSNRLKRWVLAMGRKERERIRALEKTSSGTPPPAQPNGTTTPMQVDGQPPPASTTQSARPRPELDEIACERGVTLLPERKGPPGLRPPVQLHSTTHAPTLQHIAERINLICAQHDLNPPSRPVASLMSLACEAKLKQLITHALTLTLSSQAISSINTSGSGTAGLLSLALSGEQGQSSSSLASSSTHHHMPQRAPILTAPAFQSLFTLYPASLPNKSAAAMRLAAIPSPAEDDSDDIPVLKDREVRDQRWQIMALLAERSTVRESLKAVR
ncbi:hypothetical protein CC1G_09038 [Coprinopsis cinerea okayama7|uniref:Transcriptional regulator of RNA polII, SAGA, subunit-domain-containing protein n=1 Tax=Coprinopsis cinerea (strain Okayama-7 / 130 / ATCC MYA-4618 / FGSC 9003) TaxID=240176 RepID=A8N9K3_COPC7|nr:hypothetical protein CC1G_09038 [Coprinopsis cinerea okayama7\|eukprot:XP_001831509.1 hypothetical protein CC1G_09038 [Coprinopsis cinerea okayama7\